MSRLASSLSKAPHMTVSATNWLESDPKRLSSTNPWNHLSLCKVDTDNVTAFVEGEDFLTSAISALCSHETSAINLLTTFLNANLLEHMPTLSLPNRENTGGRMQIDSHTIRALEI